MSSISVHSKIIVEIRITFMLTLSFRAIFHGLGVADNPDQVDYYTKTCGFPLVYLSEDDPEVVNEMKLAAKELSAQGDSDTSDVEIASSESSGDESDNSNEVDWVDEADDAEADKSKRKKKKRFTVIDKVQCYGLELLTCTTDRCLSPVSLQLHAIVVEILRSEVKRGRM
jgi:hypothetical protein